MESNHNEKKKIFMRIYKKILMKKKSIAEEKKVWKFSYIILILYLLDDLHKDLIRKRDEISFEIRNQVMYKFNNI